MADFYFLRSLLKGDRVTVETVNWMRSFSKIVWAGIAILFISGLGLFLLDPSNYLHSPGFLAKMTVVAVLVINGYFLNFYVTARLTTFNFSQKYVRSDAAWKIRKLSMIFGAVSGVSWYSALIIAEFKNYFSVSYFVYIGLFFLALACAIAGSLTLEVGLYRRAMGSANRLKEPTIDQLSHGPPPSTPNTAPAQPIKTAPVSQAPIANGDNSIRN